MLVLINFLVGGMVGLERTILPLIAERDFGLESYAAAISFIATFGITKALINLFAGSISEYWGRKKILVWGWVCGLPIPIILIYAQDWSWILFANVLLGINQAFAWSMTVVMKVDLVHERRRGLAIGLNEFAGYFGLALTAYLTAQIADEQGLRPYPFYLGFALAAAGLIISMLTRDTQPGASPKSNSKAAVFPLKRVFKMTTVTVPELSSASVSGLVTNLKDGMFWGLLPIFLTGQGLEIGQVGIVVAVYPIFWSVVQLVSGPASDKLGRKWIIASGMLVQGLGIAGFIFLNSYEAYIFAAIITGVGTAMVYPTLLALVSDHSDQNWRASALGVYRFWRDLGYAVGALGAGILADVVGIRHTMLVAAMLTVIAAIDIIFRVRKS